MLTGDNGCERLPVAVHYTVVASSVHTRLRVLCAYVAHTNRINVA